MGLVLAVNAGSSSLKLALFDGDDPALPRVAGESFDGLDDDAERARAQDAIADWCRRHGSGRALVAAGHRVVHGGTRYAEPVVIADGVIPELEALVPLAPLHQPQCLGPIRSLRASHPSLTQVACFDTAFHRGRPSSVERYGLPDWMYREGILRYGFHGLSYEYIASALRSVAPALAAGRVVVAHLGSGASLCAMHDGRSVDTTMGFSALSGVVMGSRCGELDPGVVLHLLRDGTRSVAEVERLLYRESGLRGISGVSADMRELLASKEPAAREAVETFVIRIVREIGALAAMLGGLDGLVFTAGIGEHSAEIRERVSRGCEWLGLRLHVSANRKGAGRISAARSKVAAWVIPTDEERMIATHVLASVQERKTA